MNLLIQGCKLLNNLETPSQEEVEGSINFKLDLVLKLYLNNYDFNNEELIILIQQLD